MKFYCTSKPQYLETGTFVIGLWAGLLQVTVGMNFGQFEVPNNVTLCPIAFASKSLSSAELQHSSLKHEALVIWHGLERFHHYSFAKEVCAITDHTALLTVASKDVIMLSQWLQDIMLHTNQYNMHILFKPGPELYIADWLSHSNHIEDMNQEIIEINVNIPTISTTVDIQICTSIEEKRTAISQDVDLQLLKTHINGGWPHM